MKTNIKLLFIVLIAFLLSCYANKKNNTALTSNPIPQKLNLDSIFQIESKRILYDDYLIKVYWTKKNTTSVNLKAVVCDSSHNFIGMYEFWQNSAHFLGSHYFLNYRDTIVFIEYKDTIKWNGEIDRFLLTNDNMLSNYHKETIKKQKLNK